jgi:transposase InsO family protein
MAFLINSVQSPLSLGPMAQQVQLADNNAGLSTALDQDCQFSRDTTSRDEGARGLCEAFPDDDVEHPKSSVVDKLVMHEIPRSRARLSFVEQTMKGARIGPRLEQDQGSRSDRLAPRLSLAHHALFLVVEPIDPVDARRLAFAAQQHKVPSIDKPTDSAFIEVINGRIFAECLNEHWFQTLADAVEKLESWRRYYNETQSLSAIGNKVPITLTKSGVNTGMSS